MPILENPVTRKDLAERHCNFYESMTKAVVDLARNQLAVGAEMHADLEQILLDKGSALLWLHPESWNAFFPST